MKTLRCSLMLIGLFAPVALPSLVAQAQPPSNGLVRVCVPQIMNVSTRSVDLDLLRERLVKLLTTKQFSAITSDGTAEHPDYSSARDLGCEYLVRSEIRELRLKTYGRSGITFGSPRTPDVAQPQPLNSRYVSRIDFAISKLSGSTEIASSVANGESDNEFQAAAAAVDIVASRVRAELKKPIQKKQSP